MPEKGRLRLAVDVARWNPDFKEFDFLCSLLPLDDAEACRKFKFSDDKKRALVSRLLQRYAAFLALDIPYASVDIKRTRGRKPYVANEISKSHAPNYNYSVSHEGDYVVLASETVCVCGCDVAAPNQLRRNNNEPLRDVLSAFTNQLTTCEWSIVNQDDDELKIESRFRQFWSLKEAFVKATGEGLGFDLGRCEFKILSNTDESITSTAIVSVDGVHQSNWVFYLHKLGSKGGGHWVSVARAPLSAVVDAWGGFKATFQLPIVPEYQFKESLSAVEPPFTMLQVYDLVPREKVIEYEAAGGDLC